MKRERERERERYTDTFLSLRISPKAPNRKRRNASAADSARQRIPRNTLKSSFQLRACRPRNEKCETRVALRCGSTTVRASLVEIF
jgi:hypothetical protein